MFSVWVRKAGKEILRPFPWKVGIVGFMAFPETIKYKNIVNAFKILAYDPFFDLIEFHEIPDEDWEKIRPIIEKTGIKLSLGLQLDVLMNKYNPNDLDEDKRKSAVELFKKRIEKADERDINTVAICSGPYPGPDKVEESKSALEKTLRELLDFADKFNMDIVLETFDRTFDKKLLLGPLNETAELVRKLRENYDNIGILWDLSHAPMLGEKPENLYDAKDLLMHIHIGCTKATEEGYKDWHPGFYRPGAINNINDVKDLLKVLSEINYEGAVSFEVKPEENQLPLEVINSAKGVLYTAYAKMVLEEGE